MSWERYRDDLDGWPREVSVDLSLAVGLPDGRRSTCVRFRTSLVDPDPDGLPGDDEREALREIQETLIRELTATHQLVPAGRILHDGRAELIFYSARADSIAAHGIAALPQDDASVWEIAVQRDAGWRTFLDELYPSPERLREIQDRRTMRAALDQGWMRGEDVMIGHWVRFADEPSSLPFLDGIGPGFEVRLGEDDEDPVRTHIIELRAVQPLDGDAIFPIAAAIQDLARTHDGRYVGWAPIDEDDD